MTPLKLKTSVPIMGTVLMLFFLPGPVGGNIFNSPHDLYEQGYLQLTEDLKRQNPQCKVCHPLQTDGRPLIWDSLPESLLEYGKTGNICASCHDGVAIVDQNVDAGLTVYHPQSHGYDPGNGPTDTELSNTGLAYVKGEKIECSLCHDPHNPARRPFLRVPLEGLCVRCHKNKVHQGYGTQNVTGTHPVGIEPYDQTKGASPIIVDAGFMVPFPEPYPLSSGMLAEEGHWTLGGHLTFGTYGKIECTTCHAFHGIESVGPTENLLSKDPVKEVSNEFCEGCHKGERGDKKSQPPYPNPGGTVTERTYHPVDDDEANGTGWIAAIADTTERIYLEWGKTDTDTDLPLMICTSCHVAHGGMENSPALIDIPAPVRDGDVDTFCEICHREPPVGHHGYENDGLLSPEIAQQISSNQESLGKTYGEPLPDRVYCSHCHRAHNAGYGRVEVNFIPILVDMLADICANCHQLGVSHFMGDPTLPSTYDKLDPPLYRGEWPATGMVSAYDGEGDTPTTITCLTCHYLTPLPGTDPSVPHKLLAPAGPDSEWSDETPEDYLCIGCHGMDAETFGEGHTHPLLEADWLSFPNIYTTHLLPDEYPATYTQNGNMNCHSCHVTHNAITRGGAYIFKVGDGDNIDPKAIHPKIDFTRLCHSCHPASAY
ncbi:MAG: cytochrome c3 family protein [bacterium]|nr:cytochrome c3 family protein [bacterium]